MRHLGGYRSAGVRYVLTPIGYPLRQSHTTFKLVFRSRTTSIYRLAGASNYFSAAGCRISSSGRTSAQVDCGRPAALVRRETWFPGWSAQVDGRPATIRRVDRLFQAVAVPVGSHRVTFSFEPPGMDFGLLGLLAGAALLCGPGLLARLRWAPGRSGPAPGWAPPMSPPTSSGPSTEQSGDRAEESV
jgi:hypothetical protein